jgi:hypothetical protein
MGSTAGTMGAYDSSQRMKLIIKWQFRKDRYSKKIYYFRARRPFRYSWAKW